MCILRVHYYRMSLGCLGRSVFTDDNALISDQTQGLLLVSMDPLVGSTSISCPEITDILDVFRQIGMLGLDSPRAASLWIMAWRCTYQSYLMNDPWPTYPATSGLKTWIPCLGDHSPDPAPTAVGTLLPSCGLWKEPKQFHSLR